MGGRQGKVSRLWAVWERLDHTCRIYKQKDIQGQGQASLTARDTSSAHQKSNTMSKDPFPTRLWGCGSPSATHLGTVLGTSRGKKKESWSAKKLFLETLDKTGITFTLETEFYMDWLKQFPLPPSHFAKGLRMRGILEAELMGHVHHRRLLCTSD